jgi:hypothetical protein
MELLIIDEVVCFAPICWMLWIMMQTVRKKTTPFGGVQVLFIGDLLQLPPVIRDEEWRTLRTYYKNSFSFACGAAKSAYMNYQNFPSDRFHLYFCFE